MQTIYDIYTDSQSCPGILIIIISILMQDQLQGGLLGSKTLGTNVLEFQFVYVGKP